MLDHSHTSATNAVWTRFTGKYQHLSQMSTKTVQFIADLTKSIHFAEKQILL
jgi:hypothetical protein